MYVKVSEDVEQLVNRDIRFMQRENIKIPKSMIQLPSLTLSVHARGLR